MARTSVRAIRRFHPATFGNDVGGSRHSVCVAVVTDGGCGSTYGLAMTKPTTTRLDDGQPLVEFAPLKPAEFAKRMNPLGAILQGNVGIILYEESETI